MKFRMLAVLTMMCTAGCGSLKTNMQSAPAGAPRDARAAAEHLLDVLQMDENFDRAMQQSIQMPAAAVDQMDLSDEEKEAARAAMQKSLAAVTERFTWEKMKGMFVDIYAEVFTAEELDGIAAFYESPAGQKFVLKQPQLMQVTMQKMQGVMKELLPEIQKAAQCEVEKIKADLEKAADAEMP